MKKVILAVVSWSLLSPWLPETVLAGLSAPLKSTGGGRAMFAGDLNNDGHDDLVVFPADAANFNVVLSRGDGALRTGGTFNGPKERLCEPTGLQDANGDGHVDVVASSYVLNDKKVASNVWGWVKYPDWTLSRTIWLGNGDGTFGKRNTTSQKIQGTGGQFVAWPYLPIKIWSRPQSFLLADFDGDGEADFAQFSDAKGEWRYTGPLAVSFDFEHSPYDPVYFDIGGGQYLSIVAGDFNGDGWVDVVVAGATNSGKPNNELTVLLNDGAW